MMELSIVQPVPEMALPVPPETLTYGEVMLRFSRVVFGDPSRGLVPYFHYRILIPVAMDAGHINFRVGDTEHVRKYVGHIGFEVAEWFRGNNFALQACRAIAPFVRTVYKTVIITCNPENTGSQRTIEELGALFLDEVEVPPHDPHYASGARRKRRYAWIP
jgi:tagatose 1,6-diphosphate aldolase